MGATRPCAGQHAGVLDGHSPRQTARGDVANGHGVHPPWPAKMDELRSVGHGEGGDGYIDRSIELMKEHPMYPKLKQYETELGRDLSFHEMQSHCLYETDGLLEKEQKQIQKEYRYHTAVLEFNEFIENKGYLDDKDRYLDNGYGYLVLYGNK